MARIRTIKPEFFTSEDIVALSPLARLLYIATWCEADKEGRLAWKPGTFKLRYLPADNCDINALCAELVSSGLVVLYGDGLAYIPSFGKHQHINPRESASSLPEPDASARVGTRRDASARVNSGIDAQGGREGKGREEEVSVEAKASTSSAEPTVRPEKPDRTPSVPCPYEAIVGLYHAALPNLPRCRLMPAGRQKAMRKVWGWVLSSTKSDGTRRATNAEEALAWLGSYFARAAENDFLTGRSPRGPGHEGWSADLDFLLTDKGMKHVVELTKEEHAA